MEIPNDEVAGRTLVLDAVEQLEENIRQAGARVTIAQDFPHFRVNAIRATQAIYNLVANALKFHQTGQAPEIDIAPYWAVEEEENRVGIVVRDRGIGVEPAHAHRIFQLFQRAVGREVRGTGAGLAIVQQVAQRHGGEPGRRRVREEDQNSFYCLAITQW